MVDEEGRMASVDEAITAVMVEAEEEGGEEADSMTED
jgi:hypothetical protein